jgi:uncharacterized caspase-like protein
MESKSAIAKLRLLGWMTMLLLLAAGGTNAVDLERSAQVTSQVNLSSLERSPQQVAQRERRTALVIGNGAYSDGRLQNPPNDAADMANALKQLGFEVTLLTDADKRRIEEAINQFNYQLRQGGVGLFYYAGHGVQVNGENYLIPIGAKTSREQDVQYEAVPLGRILGAMEDARNQINFVLVDACRNNPYSRGWRSSSRGLADVRAARGTLISFATAPGQVAADGDARNSPYTASLLQHIQDPGVPVEVLFRNVRNSVIDKTGGEQTPWESTSLTGNFAFKLAEPVPTSSLSPTPTPKPQPSPTASVTISTPSPSSSPRAHSPSPIPSPSEPTLISKATGVNYGQLRDLLTASKWKEADLETGKVIWQAAGSLAQAHRYLMSTDIESISCEDLRIINRLWVNASDGKFGFSVQSQIYRDLGGTREYNEVIWKKFGDQVGWRRTGKWLNYSDLSFDLYSNKGHLPLFAVATPFVENLRWDPKGELGILRWTVTGGGGGVVNNLEYLFFRAKSCGL